MSKKNVYTYKKPQQAFVWKWIFCIFLLAVLVSSLLIKVSPFKTAGNNTSVTDDEIVEAQQNHIPSDVQKNLDQENKVLGSQISDSWQSVQLPESLHVPILMYHYVEYVQNKGDTKRIALNTTPYALEKEIITLQQAGYTFMTNAELTEALDGKTRLPSNPIVLTFDDGYRDFYTDAYPILKKYHVKATQYTIAGFLDRQNHLLTSQLVEIANDGLVEIGAHTVHHVWLKGQKAATIQYEIAESKRILESIIHKPVISFAYPYGAFDLQAIQAVNQAGFTSAASTIPGIDQLQAGRYFLYRLRPGGRTGQYLLSWLRSVQNK